MVDQASRLRLLVQQQAAADGAGRPVFVHAAESTLAARATAGLAVALQREGLRPLLIDFARDGNGAANLLGVAEVVDGAAIAGGEATVGESLFKATSGVRVLAISGGADVVQPIVSTAQHVQGQVVISGLHPTEVVAAGQGGWQLVWTNCTPQAALASYGLIKQLRGVGTALVTLITSGNGVPHEAAATRRAICESAWRFLQWQLEEGPDVTELPADASEAGEACGVVAAFARRRIAKHFSERSTAAA